jgi:uncharacterized membrane protein YgaE (UPF0421/DUF939 family)
VADAPLLNQAAARSRLSLRTRLARVRVAWRTVVQSGLAAGLAYVIAADVIGHQRPFFAPVAAIVILGLTISQRGRRALEVAIGVAVGIAVGDLLVLAIGVGAIQLAVVVMLTVTIALLVGRGQMLVNQAAVSAALVATLQPPSHGITFARFLDALVGGAVALAVNALILPARPDILVRRAAWPVLDELAATLDDVAAALDERDAGRAERALARARAIDELIDRLDEALDAGRETTRYSPPRRGSRGYVESWAGVARPIDFAVRNVRVLARGAIRALQLDENVPPEVADSLRALAAAVRSFDAVVHDGEDPDGVRAPALRAAAGATLVLERTANLSVSVIVGQVRSTATDLLMASGMDSEQATAAVRAAAAAAEAEAEAEL